MTNLLTLPSFSQSGHLQGIIEIPAGTNRKYEVDKQTGMMQPDIRNGKIRMIDFLPYPVNYGFIPSTIMTKDRGGDGDPLDILYLAEHVPNGTVVEAIPIGLLLLKDLGELDHKVLAIPVDPEKRIIAAENWEQFQLNYAPVRTIIEQFFLYYDGPGVMTLCGWADGVAALEEVRKWKI